MIRTTLFILLTLVVVAHVSAQTIPGSGQILENVRFEIPQFRDVQVEVGEISETATAGLYEGSLVVDNNQNYRFLLTEGQMYIIALEPIDVSRTETEIAQLLEEEKEAMAAMAEERNEELARFTAGMPSRGSLNAPVAIYEFSDFQCPYCARGFATIEELLDKFSEDVSFVFLHLPLEMHEWAKPAAIASVCAASQDADAFWGLHDSYFQNQQEINSENLLEKSSGFLEGHSIDMEQWSACAADEASAAYRGATVQVEASMELASRYGITGTPSFFVNGQVLSGIQSVEVFEELVRQYVPQ